MKKVLMFVLMLFLILSVSCETSTNNGNNTGQDSSLDGIDLSKYEMPQTDFLNDGHELSNFEKIAKHVITQGTFVYEPVLDDIGYEIILQGDKKGEYSIIFFCVNYIKLAFIGTDTYKNDYGRTYSYQKLSYIKLFNEDDELNLCYKLKNSMGDAVSIIIDVDRSTFSADTNTGDFLLFRNNTRITLTEEFIMNKLVSEIDALLKLYNEKIGEKNNLKLSTINFLNY